MTNRTALTVLGFLLIIAAVTGWYMLPDRSEFMAGGMLVLGGFLVSKSAMLDVVKALGKLLRAQRGSE